MENKLTWVELKKVVARQTELTEKEVNTLLTACLDEMTAALKRGEELHINGLGTFRMKTMKARKSVNVTTGESIVLPETDRLTFTMAAGLEDLLQDKVPAKKEATVDPIQKLSSQADEIVDLLGELGQRPNTSLGDGSEAAYRLEVRGEEPQPQPQPQPQLQPKEEKEKKGRLWLTASITILVFAAVMVGLFFFFQNRMESWLEDLRDRAAMVESVSESVSESESISESESVSESESGEVDNSSITDNSTVGRPSVNYRTYTEFITTEKMHKDSRLAWMAYRYYGKKELWVFIYDANKDQIANPEHIVIGTPIRIPKLSQEVIEMEKPELQALVEEMKGEFLGSR